jgi:undecaprenyl-diphosphatase
MGIPVIGGAAVWKLREIVSSPPPSSDFAALVVGMLAAAISGLIAISFLLRYLRTNSTGIFIAYRLIFAGVVAVGVLLLIR